MKMSATIKNRFNNHETFVRTNDTEKEMQIPPKDSGFGSSVNGGELLLLSLATCFCNDLYREAAKRKITITDINVEVACEFGLEGEAGKNFTYKANIIADASQKEIEELIAATDKVAEIHNTLRQGVSITLSQ
jgi:uncharacterized OsmC-like protein